MSALWLRARRPSVAGVAFISLFVLCLLALYIGFETPINAPMTSLPGMARPAHNQNYLFETVPGFFHQTIDATDSDAFDPLSSNLGLIDNGPLRWHTFKANISGTWQRLGSWSKLDTDGTLVWGPDALLTPLGISQAQNVSVAWKAQAKAGVPLPTSFYTSPLSRAMDTLNVTWGDWVLGTQGARGPLVMEALRETIGVHTCDKRKSKAYIHDRYPTWSFENGFAEDDPFWTPDDRETAAAQQLRAQQALVDIMNRDDSTYISITCHGGEIAALLRVIGHRPFSVGTGGMFLSLLVE
ncbi:hypothetical protein EIP86_002314 [Pleurotus ostreatoroseus]|nr:hypothetical protein EIP86_002314 [Pleurotus ostreatoroseus]